MKNKKIDTLRKVLKQKSIDAFIIPTTDAHQSEYIADHWKCREWLTGFTGSAGVAIVTNNTAHLWTDSRYFIQANNQLETPFTLQKQHTKQPEYINWLAENIKPGSTIGYNGVLFPAAHIQSFTDLFRDKGIEIKDVGDVFNEVWIDRPQLEFNLVYEHPIEFAGKSRLAKIEDVKKQLIGFGTSNLLLSKLDDIAWLLNIRGSDIEYNPVPTTYFLMAENKLILFAQLSKIDISLKEALNNDNIELLEYNSIFDTLKEFGLKFLILEKSTVNAALYNSINTNCQIINQNNIISNLKAIKNNTEIERYKKAQLRDSIAMCKFLIWLEENYLKQNITELSAAKQLETFRMQQDNFSGISFNSISAFGANAALPHYSATEESNSTIDDSNLYLIDSGGQYLDGTTDITRTIHLGEPTPQQKEDFTLVLKGHINLASARFPKGTKGYQLDPLARQALWQKGKDFGHGTGHGIGYFLNVHEGPQGFSTEANGPAGTIFYPGMLTTNEPGFYLDNEYGIRIENILLCIQKSENFYEFETINFCPIDLNLIDVTLLNETEKKWINNYHQTTFDKLSVLMDEKEKNWLKEKTKSI